MSAFDQRSQNEISHGKKLIASGNPELIWNWDTPAGQRRAVRRAQLLTEAAALKPNMRVMEIGCGTGLFTELLMPSHAHILAVDISPDLLEIARKRNLPAEYVEFREMRFEDGDSDELFDAIVGSSVLHHLDMQAAFDRINQLLKPGGVLAFAEPNMLNPQIWAERNIGYIRRKMGVSPDETAIVPWRLARQMAQIGFTDIHIQHVDFLHPATPAALVPAVERLTLILEKIPVVKWFSGSVILRARKKI